MSDWAFSTRPDILVYSAGLCHACVCVPRGMTREEVEEGMGPSGTKRGWRVSEDERFKTGEPNPCPCEEDEGRVHYLLDC